MNLIVEINKEIETVGGICSLFSCLVSYTNLTISAILKTYLLLFQCYIF